MPGRMRNSFHVMARTVLKTAQEGGSVGHPRFSEEETEADSGALTQ